MEDQFSPEQWETIHCLAGKYVWWQTVEEALAQPERVLAAAMNLGSIDDYQKLYRTFDHELLAEVLRLAAPGWFSARSWSFWHRVLDLVELSRPVPPPPVRSFS